MPIGTSDGELFENDFEYTVAKYIPRPSVSEPTDLEKNVKEIEDSRQGRMGEGDKEKFDLFLDNYMRQRKIRQESTKEKGFSEENIKMYQQSEDRALFELFEWNTNRLKFKRKHEFRDYPELKNKEINI